MGIHDEISRETNRANFNVGIGRLGQGEGAKHLPTARQQSQLLLLLSNSFKLTRRSACSSLSSVSHTLKGTHAHTCYHKLNSPESQIHKMMAVRSPESEEGPPSSNEAASKISSAKGATFPTKLYAMLQLSDSIPAFAKAVTWLPHGRAFSVLNKDAFMEDVVPVFFNQTKIRSFNRQLHLWGFRR